jgi:hypothetical protein
LRLALIPFVLYLAYRVPVSDPELAPLDLAVFVAAALICGLEAAICVNRTGQTEWLARSFGSLGWILGIGAVLGVALTAVTGHVYIGPYSERTRVSEGILIAASAKTQISERYAAGVPADKVGEGVEIKATGVIENAQVTPNGVITVTLKTLPAVVIMRPEFLSQEARIKWICKGTPIKLMPSSCR